MEMNSMAQQHYIIGSVPSKAGSIPRISTRLGAKDYLGTIMVRWNIRRNNYRVEPGLYAIGVPDERSDVFVTANYKLSFDTVRKNLYGLNVWLLVLDTKGINVWCSAGKGTFGTKELIRSIRGTSLETVISHRRLILPQLGAVGVAAHLVKQESGFSVIYGPVRASDIQAYIQSNYKVTKEMRRVKFGFFDRLTLVPNDIIHDMRYLLPVLAAVFIISGLNKTGFLFQQAFDRGIQPVQNVIFGYCAGIILTPLLLPYIPTRAFASKGYIVGVLLAFLLFAGDALGNTFFDVLAWFFFIAGASSFLAMNFTGASTYTSLSGVKKEMKIAVPLQVASGALSLLLFLTGTIVG